MPLSKSELDALVSNVKQEGSPTAVALACLVQLATVRLSKQGPEHQQGIQALHALGMKAVKTYAREAGVPWGEVASALRALQRAGRTAGYLHTLPD